MVSISGVDPLENYNPLSPRYLSGKETRSFLLLADTHYNQDNFYDRSFRDDLKTFEEYGDIFDCDEILVAGDIGDLGDIGDIIYSDFDYKRLVKGDNDEWDLEEVEDVFLADRLDVDYGHEVRWEVEVADKEYELCMRHKPDVLGMDPDKRKPLREKYESVDVAIHGHRHVPNYRVLEDGKLGISLGSRFSNYIDHSKKGPNKTIQILELDSVCGVKHIDFENDEIIEEGIFDKNNGRFSLLEEWTKEMN